VLREEHRLSVFENRVLRRIFGPKRDEVMWTGLVWLRIGTGEELCTLPMAYFPLNYWLEGRGLIPGRSKRFLFA
jgi:hypothetical protein